MAEKHTQTTDRLDTTKSTATVTIKGLGLFCFTEQGTFEGGFLRRPDHELAVVVKERVAEGTGEAPGVAWQVFNLRGDVEIKVLRPARPKALRYERGDFERTGEANDPHDFRWVLDLEGPSVHGAEVKPKQAGGVGAPAALSRLTIDAGTFYTKAVSQEVYARVRTDQPDPEPALLGRIAREVGVEIEFADEPKAGLLITVRDGQTRQEVGLLNRPGVKYDLFFMNDCPPPPAGSAADGTDFRFFYDLIADPSGKKFDLALVVDEHDDKAKGGSQLPGHPTKFKDGFGLVCDTVYLSQKSTLSQLG